MISFDIQDMLILLLPVGTLIALIYYIINVKLKFSFASEENIKLRSTCDTLSKEKIEYIRHIQELSDQVEHLKSDLQNQEQARKEAFDSAKASLFDLGNSLSKQLIDLHKQENKEVKDSADKTLKNTTEKFQSEFEKIVSMVAVLSKEIDQSKSTVDVIKKSLLSPSGAGKLAEITLENILKSSGLRSNIDFHIQHSLTNRDESKLRPDAVIYLPGDNLMIIDAKASKFLCELSTSTNEEETNKLSNQLIKTMMAHLKDLSSKDYAEGFLSTNRSKSKNYNNVITLMFLPTEVALEQIANIDSTFITKAWAANIFPVGPAGLMNMLSFAKFQINDHMRTENHKLIIEEVRKLIGSINILADHSQKLGNNIQSLANNYDKFSASFNRNFLPKARNIQSLGVDIGKERIKPLERYHIISAQKEIVEDETILITQKTNDEEAE